MVSRERSRPAVAEHPWLRRATDFCLTAAAELTEASHAMEIAFTARFLDAVRHALDNDLDTRAAIAAIDDAAASNKGVDRAARLLGIAL